MKELQLGKSKSPHKGWVSSGEHAEFRSQTNHAGWALNCYVVFKQPIQTDMLVSTLTHTYTHNSQWVTLGYFFLIFIFKCSSLKTSSYSLFNPCCFVTLSRHRKQEPFMVWPLTIFLISMSTKPDCNGSQQEFCDICSTASSWKFSFFQNLEIAELTYFSSVIMIVIQCMSIESTLAASQLIHCYQ